MTTYEHAEAFCLMEYQCQKCSGIEILWNSRDGVTPFAIRCQNCTDWMNHINFRGDIRAERFSAELLSSSKYAKMRVFTTVTREKAEQYAHNRLFMMKEAKQPVPLIGTPEYRAVHWDITEEIYHNGEGVDVVTAAEFLVMTVPTSKAVN